MERHTDTAALGRELAAVTMGIDSFEPGGGRGESLLDGEGLVPIWLGADLVEAKRYGNWDEARADLAGLATAAAALAPGPRQVFLKDMLRSLDMAVKLFSGATPSFAEKVETLVGASAGREDEDLIETARDRLDRLLARAGIGSGTLKERVAAWEEARAVPSEEIEPVFRELMREAKRRTDATIFDTGDYDMALNPIRDAHYTARCSFDAGQMDLNLDIRFTRAALKHLVCHEVYPGHSTQLLSTRAAVERGESPADALLVTANAVTGCVQEGIGDQGIHLIDFVEDEDDEIHAELRRVRSAAQTSAAWMLMAEGVPREEVADYLRNVAMGQEAWVQGRLRMAAHPFRGPFISSYFAGNEAVRRVRERVTAAERPAFIAALYDRAQSPASLAMFPLVQEDVGP